MVAVPKPKGVVPDVELVNIYEGIEFGEREYKKSIALGYH